ncbi:MAG: hypothetical protein PVJ67_02555 [Candidatus Pacearchaeota archaeon]|jgi:SSS family solute:Na+ symporter
MTETIFAQTGIIDVLLLLAYFAVMLAIGFFNSKKKTNDSYLIADRKAGAPTIGASLSAGFVGGGTLLVTATLTFFYGFGAMWLYIGLAAGFLIFPFFFRKIKKENYYTLSDYVYDKLGGKNQILVTLMIFVVYFAYILSQIIALGKAVEFVLQIPYILSIGIVSIIILIYLILGGFKSVLKTDLFQYGLLLVLFTVLVFAFFNGGTISANELNLFNLDIVNIIALTLFGFISVFVLGEVWQRGFAAKDEKTMMKGFFIAALIMIVLGASLVIVGFNAKNSSVDVSQMAQDAFFYGFEGILPFGLSSIVVILILVSVMSTLDTSIFLTSMNISNDILYKFGIIRKDQLQLVCKISMIMITIIGILLSLFIEDMGSVVYNIVAMMLIFFPAVILSRFINIPRAIVFRNIILGLLVFIIMYIMGMFNYVTALIPSLVALVHISIELGIRKIFV